MLRGLLILTILALVAGCDGPRPAAKNSTTKTQDPLGKASPLLGLMEFETKIGQQVNCALHDSLAKRDGTRDSKAELANSVIAKMTADAETKCALFRYVSQKSAPVFQVIRDSGALPAEAYVFSFMEEAENGFSEQEVGLFASAGECDQIEGFARDHDLATRRCRRWPRAPDGKAE